MAKVEATRSYGANVEMGGEALEEAIAAARRYVEETGATFVHPYEDEVVVAGQGTIGLELAEQVPRGGDRARPDRRGRARGRDRDGAQGGEAGDEGDRRPRRARRLRARRRDRREEAGRADDADPRRPARRNGRGRRRRHRPGDRAAARADEARRRGRGRGRDRRPAGGEDPGRRAGRGRALRREHRREHADHGHAPRGHARRAAPRRTHPCPRPAGRAAEAPPTCRRRARQRPISGASA